MEKQYGLGIKHFKSNGYDVALAFRKSSESISLFNGISIHLAGTLIKGWLIQSGIDIQQIEMQVNYQIEEEMESKNIVSIGENKNQLTYASIPFAIVKSSSYDFLCIDISFGTSLDYLYSADLLIKNETDIGLLRLNQQDLRKINVSVNAGSRFGFYITKELVFFTSMNIGTYLFDARNTKNRITQKLSYGTAGAGFKFRF